MKILIAVIALITITYINYNYAETLVYYFGLIGAMIIVSLTVLFAGSLIANKLFPNGVENE